jgi:hypothetical protein
MAAGIPVVAAVVGSLVVQTTTRSSLQELAYWVDWENLASITVGFGVAALAFAWPASALTRRTYH